MDAKDLNKKLKQGHEKMLRHFGEYRWLYIYTLVFIVIFCFCFYWDNFYIDINNDKISFYTRYVDSNYFKAEDVKLEVIVSMIISFVTFLLAIVSLNFFRKRVKNQDKQVQEQVKQVILQREQIDFQIVQRTDERFTTAVNLLGSSGSSARTGAIYALYHLAVDDERYRRQIAQILCSHIRSRTQERDYHKEHPTSNEIQTCINLLFKPKSKSEGLYIKYDADLDEADLSYAHLVGVDFSNAQCQGVNFSWAQCQGANFFNAQCQGADFMNADCQGTHFSKAQCQSANFRLAHCQGAEFIGAECQGAIFYEAQCQSANFSDAQCQGAYFYRAQCESANFSSTHCQGADFQHAQCQGANFYRAQCQGVMFLDAQCQGANFYSAKCQGARFMATKFEGAHALDNAIKIELADRVGKETQLDTMVFAGPLDDEAIKAIEVAKECVSDGQYQELQEIIEVNKDKETDCTVPDGITTGKLKKSEEIEAIIAKDWDKFKELEKARKLAGVNKSREV